MLSKSPVGTQEFAAGFIADGDAVVNDWGDTGQTTSFGFEEARKMPTLARFAYGRRPLTAGWNPAGPLGQSRRRVLHLAVLLAVGWAQPWRAGSYHLQCSNGTGYLSVRAVTRDCDAGTGSGKEKLGVRHSHLHGVQA